jgi:hypothetical protein
MWVQFTNPCSLTQWIHYFVYGPRSLQPVNSFKIQWNHLVYKDSFCCNECTRVFGKHNKHENLIAIWDEPIKKVQP